VKIIRQLRLYASRRKIRPFQSGGFPSGRNPAISPRRPMEFVTDASLAVPLRLKPSPEQLSHRGAGHLDGLNKPKQTHYDSEIKTDTKTAQ